MNPIAALGLFLTIAVSSCASPGPSVSGLGINSGNWKVSRVTGSRLEFANGKTWDTKLVSPEIVSELEDESGRPVVLLIGMSCSDCDDSPGLYIQNPNRGVAKGAGNQKRYSPPGAKFDSMDNRLTEKVRVFVGKCLKGEVPEVVWHGYKIKSGKWKRNYAHLVELAGAGFKEHTYVESVPDVKKIEANVGKGLCQELERGSWQSGP